MVYLKLQDLLPSSQSIYILLLILHLFMVHLFFSLLPYLLFLCIVSLSFQLFFPLARSVYLYLCRCEDVDWIASSSYLHFQNSLFAAAAFPILCCWRHTPIFSPADKQHYWAQFTVSILKILKQSNWRLNSLPKRK